MATKNPFDILGDDDNDDLSELIEKQKKIQAKKAATPPPAAAPAPASSATSKFPSKPSPPSQAAREGRNNSSSRGGSRGGYGSGGGRGGSGRPREFRSDNENEFTDRAPAGAREDGKDVNKTPEAPRQSNRGPRRGQYQEGDSGRPQRRTYERHSGTGHGNEVPRQGSGRGNWGSFTDEPAPQELEETAKDEQKNTLTDKPTEALDAEPKDNKDEAANEAGEKEEEDKEMTLEEYEKIREENRKAILAMKSEERKVEIDKDFQSMQLLSTKKNTDEVFIQLGSGKDSQKKKDAEKDERAKKLLPINEFLKPAEGERFYGGSGGRGRGNRGRGQSRGGYNRGGSRAQAAPAIEDQLEFPTLGGK